MITFAGGAPFGDGSDGSCRFNNRDDAAVGRLSPKHWRSIKVGRTFLKSQARRPFVRKRFNLFTLREVPIDFLRRLLTLLRLFAETFFLRIDDRLFSAWLRMAVRTETEVRRVILGLAWVGLVKGTCSAAFPTAVPTTPPTKAPTGPATKAPRTAPVAPPATCLRI